MSERRTSRKGLLGFFLLEFITVLLMLELIQLAGLEAFAPVVAGIVGGVAAVVGTAVFWRFQRRGGQ
jgi:hypothetical protein